MRAVHLIVGAVLLATPAATLAQHHDDRRRPPHAPRDAAVDFGILPADPAGVLVPIGPLPCLQTGAIGGPADPCSYKLHVLLPEEVTIRKDGEVTFQIHGGGHGMAIYEVHRRTSRNDIGQYLCPGTDPAEIPDPAFHTCNGSLTNANKDRLIPDARGRVVIEVAPGGGVHPANRVWSPDDRLMSIGAHQFLNGGSIPAGATSNGQLVTYRFLEPGRYLVICMNRSHFLNDWMFGFVNVTDH